MISHKVGAEVAQRGLGLEPRNGRVRAGTLKPSNESKSADADCRCQEGRRTQASLVVVLLGIATLRVLDSSLGHERPLRGVTEDHENET